MAEVARNEPVSATISWRVAVRLGSSFVSLPDNSAFIVQHSPLAIALPSPSENVPTSSLLSELEEL
jgi:hypothetical protein